MCDWIGLWNLLYLIENYSVFKCQVSDTQRAAELDGLYPGIRKNYFINEFRQNWHEQVASLQRYLNVSQKIMTEPDWSKSRNLEQKIAPELWKELHMKCIKNKSYTLTTDSLDSP